MRSCRSKPQPLSGWWDLVDRNPPSLVGLMRPCRSNPQTLSVWWGLVGRLFSLVVWGDLVGQISNRFRYTRPCRSNYNDLSDNFWSCRSIVSGKLLLYIAFRFKRGGASHTLVHSCPHVCYVCIQRLFGQIYDLVDQFCQESRLLYI
jgi:hypothetical protein